jgi:hypothetical protein
MRGKKIAKCVRCGRKRPHYAKGKCQPCYDYEYKKAHPEFWKRCNEKSKLKYRTDPVYRKYMLDYQKEYFKKPENLEKKRIYERKYYKTHKKISKTRTGYLCECGAIDKSSLIKRPEHPHSDCHRCPQCGKCTIKRKIIYDRFTGEMIRYAD